MNHLEHKLAGVADAARGMFGKSVRVQRIRREAFIDEGGEERETLIRDEVGIGDMASLLVRGDEVPGQGVPYAMCFFSLDLLRDMSSREVAEFVAPEAERILARLRGNDSGATQ